MNRFKLSIIVIKKQLKTMDCIICYRSLSAKACRRLIMTECSRWHYTCTVFIYAAIKYI